MTEYTNQASYLAETSGVKVLGTSFSNPHGFHTFSTDVSTAKFLIQRGGDTALGSRSKGSSRSNKRSKENSLHGVELLLLLLLLDYRVSEEEIVPGRGSKGRLITVVSRSGSAFNFLLRHAGVDFLQGIFALQEIGLNAGRVCRRHP